MRQLHLVTTSVATLSIVFALGCDPDPSTGTDSGTSPTDAGPMTGTDSGPMTGTDSGPMTGVDAGPVDGGGMGMCTGPTMGDCDLTDPASCGTGMACRATGSSDTSWTTQCIMAGVGGQGTACDPMMAGQCQEGFVCSGRVCKEVCCSTADCATGDFCGLIAGLNAGTCSTPVDCDLIAQTGCDEPGEGCYPVSGGLDCVMAGAGVEGDSCMFTNNCAPSLGCIGPMGAGFCRTWCDMAATDPCPAGFMCQGITGLPVGACTPTP